MLRPEGVESELVRVRKLPQHRIMPRGFEVFNRATEKGIEHRRGVPHVKVKWD
jgi:hypothetical protein